MGGFAATSRLIEQLVLPVGEDEDKRGVCPTYEELASHLDGSLGSRGQEVLQHLGYCSRCRLAAELMEDLLRDELNVQEEDLLKDIEQKRHSWALRRILRYLTNTFRRLR